MNNFWKARKWCVKEVQYSYYQQQIALFHGIIYVYIFIGTVIVGIRYCWHLVSGIKKKDGICLVL